MMIPRVSGKALIPALATRCVPATRRSISVQVKSSDSGGPMTLTDNFDMIIQFQSLLHGSPQAKQEGDVQIQQHSRLVARGKYVHGFESEL